MDKQDIEKLLTPRFQKKHVSAALGHFSGMVERYQGGDWEPCIVKSGKFVEATVKALGLHAGLTFATGRKFSAGTVIDDLAKVPAGPIDDAIRLTIPRACRFVYDIASNRGARHDPQEVDPNEMDATVVVPNCAWILAEMVRYSQKGAVDLKQAKEMVDSLMVRKYPLIEEVDGRVYFHHKKKSAPDVALLALSYCYPNRMKEEDLIATIKRHRFKDTNARMAVTRIRKFTDDDGQGQLRLLAPGLKEAEEIMKRT
ncbi:MAG: hypothetical protein ABSA97_07670 [Verrucomicrobiia bacterium]